MSQPHGLEVRDGVLWHGNVAFLPSIHGKVAFAREARRVFLDHRFAAVAVELPPSLGEATLAGIERIPRISTVSYLEPGEVRCYFPIDPCDSIIEALRLGIGEGCVLELIDLEVEQFERRELLLPDSYAVNRIGLPRYIEAIRPAIGRAVEGSQDDLRERHMARRLLEIIERLSTRAPILCVLGLAHLDGVAEYLDRILEEGPSVLGEIPAAPPPAEVDLHDVSPESLYLVLGELPYITAKYEEERGSITLEQFEAVDQMKALLLEARDRFHATRTAEYERISTASFQNLLQLVRNLCLIQRRLTPSLYELVLAAKGIGASEFALEVINTARSYPPLEDAPPPEESEQDPWSQSLGGEEAEGAPDEPWKQEASEESGSGEVKGDAAEEPGEPAEAFAFGGELTRAKKRYIDEAKVWKRIKLEAPPPPREVAAWRKAWNPNSLCSWTPEDILIENFASHVRGRALLESGLAQERLEEFTTSFKDGLHLRETIRNFHLGKIIVKETPQPRGRVGAVVIIYEPPDPERFPWRVTWFPEHEWESVLALYATDYRRELIGPGIARCTYGGQLFVRPPGPVEEIWSDESLADARDDAERLVFAAVKHSPEAFIAYVAASPPSTRLKERARAAGKKILYLPLSSFSRTTIAKLRRFHALNGKPVRGWAQYYIR